MAAMDELVAEMVVEEHLLEMLLDSSRSLN